MIFKIRYWLSSKRRQMGKLHDLKRQLREAWDYKRLAEQRLDLWSEDYHYLRDQLHRVARERDQEREKRQTWERRSKQAWALNKILNEHIAAEA